VLELRAIQREGYSASSKYLPIAIRESLVPTGEILSAQR
jgi:hypothetical protein